MTARLAFPFRKLFVSRQGQHSRQRVPARPRWRITPYQLWVFGLTAAMLTGLAGGIKVFTEGLAVTNLTDMFPWGLWITIDLSSIALSAGAFLLCAAVYLLGLKRFQPIARTATFIGLIGYSMAVLCLMLDIGRPDRFWHALVYWNPHSVLWEVTMCVTLYFSVLILESLPILGQADWMRKRFPWLSRRLESLHHLAPILALAGLGLSMLHQSSLGATYGVLKARPIWYRPDMSVLFIVSAMAAGPSLTLLASMLAGRLSARARVDDALIERLAQFVGWVLIGYLYFRFWDVFAMTYTYQPGRTEGLALLIGQTLSFNFWAGEIVLGAVVPIVLLLAPQFRVRPVLRMLAFALIVGGVVAYRWDTNMVGQMVWLTVLPQDTRVIYTTYFPSLVEFVTGLGIVAFGLMAFTVGVRYLGVVRHPATDESAKSPELPVAGAE